MRRMGMVAASALLTTLGLSVAAPVLGKSADMPAAPYPVSISAFAEVVEGEGCIEGDVAAFRRLRAEAVAAINADDLNLAANRLAEADERVPNHPAVMILQARVAMARQDEAEAIGHLSRYAQAGLRFNLERDAALSALKDTALGAEIVARLKANEQPVGAERLSIMASIPGAGLIESIARDDAGDGWFVSQVAGRSVIRLSGRDAARSPEPLLATDAGIEGVLGLAADPRRGVLWAVSNPAPPAVHGRDAAGIGAAALLEIDLSDGRVRTAYTPPEVAGAETITRGLGDIVMHPDGSIYVSDGLAGEVYRLTEPGGSLTTFIERGVLASPQGLAVSPDGEAMAVADYSSGLWRVSASGEDLRRITAPADVSLIGVDGLIADGDVLYALQNGVAPQRVLKLVMSPDWSRIQTVDVLAANLPEIDEPTMGVVFEGELVFVSRSQWGDYTADGALKAVEPAPGLIARLRLD